LLVWLTNTAGLEFKWNEIPDISNTVFRRVVSLYGDKSRINEGAKQFTRIVKHIGIRMKRTDIREEVKMRFYNGIEQLSTQFNSGCMADVIAGYEHSSEFTFLFDCYSFLWV
jgi:hypothetical protein